MAERLGILGGTFDPIHNGHVLLARAVLEQLPLDRVLFVPAADPPHKSALVASAAHRFEMVRLALEGLDGLEASRAELDREGPSYTVETLRHFRSQYCDSDLYLIIGADNVAELPTWYDPETIVALATVVSGSRDQRSLPLDAKFGSRIQRLPTPTYDISSTDIRQRLLQGRPVRYLVPEAVERYLTTHGLYRNP